MFQMATAQTFFVPALGGDVWMVFAVEVDASLNVHVEMLDEFVGTGAPRRSTEKRVKLWDIGALLSGSP